MNRPRATGSAKRENSVWRVLSLVVGLEQKFLLAFGFVEHQLCHTFEHMELSRHCCHMTILSEFK